MSAVPAFTLTTIEPHTCKWRTRAERAEQKIAELTTRLNELQAWEERRRKYDDIPNQALSPKARLLAVHLDQEKRKWEAAGKTGPQRIDIEKLGEDIGFGRKACEGALGELDRVDHTSVLRGEPEDIEITTKKGRRTITIRPYLIEPLGRDPDELDLTGDRNHGGRRCRSCPKGAGVHIEQEPDKIEIIKRTKKRAKIICNGCGDCLGRTTHTTEEPLRQPRFKENKQHDSSPDISEFQIEIEERSSPAEPPAPEIAISDPLGNINQIGGVRFIRRTRNRRRRRRSWPRSPARKTGISRCSQPGKTGIRTGRARSRRHSARNT